MADAPDDDGFLSRWSRRKAMTRSGPPVPPAPTPEVETSPSPAGLLDKAAARTPAGVSAPAAAEAPASPQAPLPPTLEDAALLTPASDFSRFVAPGVDPGVRNAALKQLFTDPHFNMMDGLDTYIDDYGKPDPLSPGMLRKMAQAEFLNLFADEAPSPPEVPAAATPLPEETTPDEDPDLRLQPHDAAEPASVDQGAGTDPGRQH